jgi:hypothetical protein
MCTCACATGGVEVKVTSGVTETGRLLKSSAGLPVLRLSDCPANTCSGGDVTAAAAAASANEAVKPAPVPAPAPATAAAPVNPSGQTAPAQAAATPTPAPMFTSTAATKDQGATGGRGSPKPQPLTGALLSALPRGTAGCDRTSQLGYQCVRSLGSGAMLHYSLGGMPPSNACTRRGTFDDATAGPRSKAMHFAIQSPEGVRPFVRLPCTHSWWKHTLQSAALIPQRSTRCAGMVLHRAFFMGKQAGIHAPYQMHRIKCCDALCCNACLQGYVALGFPTRPGSMVPADAVMGSVNDRSGTSKVREQNEEG